MKKYLLALLALLPLCACDKKDAEGEKNGLDSENSQKDLGEKLTKEQAIEMIEGLEENINDQVTINSQISISIPMLLTMNINGCTCKDTNNNTYTKQTINSSIMGVTSTQVVESHAIQKNGLVYTYSTTTSEADVSKELDITLVETTIEDVTEEVDYSKMELEAYKKDNVTTIIYDVAQNNDDVSNLESGDASSMFEMFGMSDASLSGKMELKFVDGKIDTVKSNNVVLSINMGDTNTEGSVSLPAKMDCPINVVLDFEDGLTVTPKEPTDKDSYTITSYPLVGTYQVLNQDINKSFELTVNKDFTFTFYDLDRKEYTVGDGVGVVSTTDYYNYDLTAYESTVTVTYQDGSFYFEGILMVKSED